MAGKKLVIIGFDSVSLSVLETFVRRGVLPTVGRLMREGSVTQTWPCFPMETGTNWASLATGASPWVTGCNMRVHWPGTPLDDFRSGFPAHVCKAEQLWTTAQKVGKRVVVFDWPQSFPLKLEEGIIHVGEDGRPDNAVRALQEVRAYTTHPRQPGPHVTEVHPQPATDWPGAPEGALAFEVSIMPGPQSRYHQVRPLYALLPRDAQGYTRVEVYVARNDQAPLAVFRPGEWTPWVEHHFLADGAEVRAGLRGKLLQLSPDGQRVHLYLSEIYPLDDFCWPRDLAPALVERCGPFIIQCSRQQVVQGGASDIATYFEEQEYLAHWWRDAAVTILGK
ncbi:MAG: alkaline phosphatase family protein, partial [Chloroflexi bacterium]|nr:alkaline phosphatase family protein [Chloroflexota bacterium]